MTTALFSFFFFFFLKAVVCVVSNAGYQYACNVLSYSKILTKPQLAL